VEWVVYFLTRLNLQAWSWSQQLPPKRHWSSARLHTTSQLTVPAVSTTLLVPLLSSYSTIFITWPTRCTVVTLSNFARRRTQSADCCAFAALLRFPRITCCTCAVSIAQQTPRFSSAHAADELLRYCLFTFVKAWLLSILEWTSLHICFLSMSLLRKQEDSKTAVIRDSSVGIEKVYGLDGQVRSPAGARDLSHLHSVQTGCGAHPAS
jgi:hypothetical protein